MDPPIDPQFRLKNDCLLRIPIASKGIVTDLLRIPIASKGIVTDLLRIVIASKGIVTVSSAEYNSCKGNCHCFIKDFICRKGIESIIPPF